PTSLGQVIARALQKNPVERYQSAAEMRSALLACSVVANVTLSPLQSSPLSETLPTLPIKGSLNQGAVPVLETFEFDMVKMNGKGRIVERQKSQARYFVEELGDGVAIEMVLVPEGTFLMGSPEQEKGRGLDEGPQHTVMVPPFYMGKFQVTQAQWRVVALWPR